MLSLALLHRDMIIHNDEARHIYVKKLRPIQRSKRPFGSLQVAVTQHDPLSETDHGNLVTLSMGHSPVCEGQPMWSSLPMDSS